VAEATSAGDVRALDEGERAVLRDLDARVFTMSDVDRLGVERAVREALSYREAHLALELVAESGWLRPSTSWR
jgi:arginase family enzyme